MPLMWNNAMRFRPVEDILLFIKDASVEEAVLIIEGLGRGTEDYYVHNENVSGVFDITELCASYEGSLLAQEVDKITFCGGPYKTGWYEGDLQTVLYDRVLYGITEYGPSQMAEIVGLNYSL